MDYSVRRFVMSRNTQWLPSFALSLLLLAGIAGCAEDNSVAPDDSMPPASVTTEKEAMEYYATANEFAANDHKDPFSVDALEPADPSPFAGLGPIIPVSWGRFVESVTTTTTTTIEPGDSIATVKVDKDITGTFRILAKYNEADTTTFMVEKPFVDHSVRNVIFVRVGNEPSRFWLNWVPVSTSLVDGKTINPPADQDVKITELMFVTPAGENIVITDPTAFYLRFPGRNIPVPASKVNADVPELSSGQTFSVRATVMGVSADTDLVYLRYGNSMDAHKRLALPIISETQNEDGTFTRVYQINAEINQDPGFFHAGVVALSMKTLYDDDLASYSVNLWGVPYRVR
jgi:hypothetical protein